MQHQHKHIVYKEKHQFIWVIVALAFVLVAMIVTSFVGDLEKEGPEGQITMAAVFVILAFVLFAFKELKIVLYEDNLWFGFWKFGKLIPVKEIEKCEPAEVKWGSSGGLGIRKSWDGSWQYTVRTGKAIRIKWKQKNNDYVITCNDPERLCKRINEMMK